MKSIILAGAPRSGKTTLARRLQKETGFSLVSGDAFMCTFQSIFPQLGINEHEDIEIVSRRLEDFLVVYLKHLVTYENIPFILDTALLMPEQVARLKLHERYQVFFFGYPDLTPEEKISDIRRHKTGHYDWTDERSDEDLLKTVTVFVDLSKKLQQECTAYGLNFINTSKDFPAALAKARELIG